MKNQTLIDLSLTNQRVSFETITVYPNFSMENPIKDMNGEPIAPTWISNGGVYSEYSNRIIWQDIEPATKSVYFIWPKDVTVANKTTKFSGVVTQPINLKDYIYIDDYNLKEVICDELDNHHCMFTSKLLKIPTILNGSRKNIENVKGIEHLTSLLYLDLSFNNISSIDVGGQSKLKYLDLAYNRLDHINVSNLCNLEVLDLFHNKLSSVHINRLSNLHELNLSNNKLTSINISSLSKVQYLNLSYNKLSSLEISNLTNLRNLYLSFNKLSNIDFRAMNYLKYLYLNEKEIKDLSALKLV